MSRRGRKRHSLAPRQPNGRVQPPREMTPREIAQAMPHRRSLGDKADDQKASYAHGRLELRGVITEEQGRALDDLARDLFRAWHVTGVRKPAVKAFDIFRVVGMSTAEIDDETAARWKARWREVRAWIVQKAGLRPFGALMKVVAFDDEDVDHSILNVGANSAMAYYRLTRRK